MPRIVQFLIIILTCNSCTNAPITDDILILDESLKFSKEMYLIRTDDKHGEFGGDTEINRIYRYGLKKELLADYKALDGSEYPPTAPGKINFATDYFQKKPIVLEQKKIKVTAIGEELIAKTVQQLVDSKLENDGAEFPFHGMYNIIAYRDSSFILHQFPSIRWSNFNDLKRLLIETKDD